MTEDQRNEFKKDIIGRIVDGIYKPGTFLSERSERVEMGSRVETVGFSDMNGTYWVLTKREKTENKGL